MNTFYSFGCSFTQHIWPTWANIIAYDLNMQHKNYASGGLGNFAIANRILEVNERIGLDSDDICMVLWSSWDREDRCKRNAWDPQGSIFCNDEAYGKWYIKKYYDDSDKIIKNIFWIFTINKIYGNTLKWQGSGFDYYKNDTYFDYIPEGINEKAKDLISIYGKLLPDLYKWLNAEDRPAFGFLTDKHPDVEKHLQLVEDVIYPAIGKTLRKETLKLFKDIHASFINAKFGLKFYQSEDLFVRYHMSEKWPEIWNWMDRSDLDLIDGTVTEYKDNVKKLDYNPIKRTTLTHPVFLKKE